MTDEQMLFNALAIRVEALLYGQNTTTGMLSDFLRKQFMDITALEKPAEDCGDVKELVNKVRTECFVDISQTERVCYQWDVDTASILVETFVKSREKAAKIEVLEKLNRCIVDRTYMGMTKVLDFILSELKGCE